MNDLAASPLASRRRRAIAQDATANLGSIRGAHISIRGQRLRLVNAQGIEVLVPTPHLDIVVVDANANTSKLFYPNGYEEDNNAPPVCYSDNGTGPSSSAMQPQSATCAVCPWNRIGSATSKKTGKPIKACSDRKKFAVVVDGSPTADVFELQIPPNSLTNMKQYVGWLEQQPGFPDRKLDLADVVTRLTFDPDQMGTLMFQAVSMADDDSTLALIDHIDANRLSDVVVGRNDVACDPTNFKTPAVADHRPAALPPVQHTEPPAIPQRVAPQPATLPPPAALPPAQPAPQSVSTAPRGRGRPKTVAAEPTATPFMAQAGQQASAPPPLNADGLDVPSFLKRTGNGTQHGMAMPGAPPAAETGADAALTQAMGLQSRR